MPPPAELLELPRPLSISLLAASSNRAAEVRVNGTHGALYAVEASQDFRIWNPSPPQAADSNGHAFFLIPLAGSPVFFRAVEVASSAASEPPEVALGRRLFGETRFAQFFFAHSGGDVNAPLTNGGDPVMDQIVTLNVPAPGPFRSQSMNCRACHLIDEAKASGLGHRLLADFAIRSPIPDRGDGRRSTVRNSPGLVGISAARSVPSFLHFDGEFTDNASLAKGTFTGRNFGWLPEERLLAVKHIAKVVREDNGAGFQGPEFGGAYGRVMSGIDAQISEAFRIPAAFRIDVSQASDAEILEAIGKFVDAYLKSFAFSANDDPARSASPYDAFLRKNALPRKPDPGEDSMAYSRRLRELIVRIASPQFVGSDDGAFTTIQQPFTFGPKELEGLRIFLAEPDPHSPPPVSKVGNCVVCHVPPDFTDFEFHNSGAAQWEYDSVHGEGMFAQLEIPSLQERDARPEDFYPPTPLHPTASGRFLAIPQRSRPGYIDLGVWNIYANPDFPASQPGLEWMLESRFGPGSPETYLSRTIALFKTPGLRSLGYSAPYLHTGQASTIEASLFFYRFTSDLARAGQIRNADPALAHIFLGKEDLSFMAAFLRSLNEDFPRSSTR